MQPCQWWLYGVEVLGNYCGWGYWLIDGDDTRNNLTVRGFADAIAKVLLDPEKARIMGNSGRERVHELFGMETFRKQWWELLNETENKAMPDV
jgi:glycosyltransferase involved in cell wall biosynthesis